MSGHPEAKPFCAEPCGHADCAGVATFPAARSDPRFHRVSPLALAEAWAWRCADTMPDSAQSRRDSMADAATLLAVTSELAGDSNADRYLFAAGDQSLQAATRAHAALHVCPGLRALVAAVVSLSMACASARPLPVASSTLLPSQVPSCAMETDGGGWVPSPCRLEVAPGEWLVMRSVQDPPKEKKRRWWVTALALLLI